MAFPIPRFYFLLCILCFTPETAGGKGNILEDGATLENMNLEDDGNNTIAVEDTAVMVKTLTEDSKAERLDTETDVQENSEIGEDEKNIAQVENNINTTMPDCTTKQEETWATHTASLETPAKRADTTNQDDVENKTTMPNCTTKQEETWATHTASLETPAKRADTTNQDDVENKTTMPDCTTKQEETWATHTASLENTAKRADATNQEDILIPDVDREDVLYMDILLPMVLPCVLGLSLAIVLVAAVKSVLQSRSRAPMLSKIV